MRDWADQLNENATRLELVMESDDITHGTIDTEILENANLAIAEMRHTANGIRNMADAMSAEDFGHAPWDRRDPSANR